jgi:hypothetical protein
MTNDILANHDAILLDIEAKYPIGYIVGRHGLSAIAVLKNTGADFSLLNGHQIYSIINFSGDHIVGIAGYRAQAIQLLSDAGANFSKLTGSEIYNIVNNEFETIQLLKDAGANFSELSNADIFYIIRQFGIKATFALRNVGASYHSVLDLNKIAAIKELCKPIIEENLYKNVQFILQLETLLEEIGFFQKHPDINNIEEFTTIIGNSPELIKYIESLDTNNFPYQIDVSGNKINHIIYAREDEYEVTNDSFPVSQEGKLLHYSKVLNCAYLVENAQYVNIFEYNQLIIMLNKHVYNFEIYPVLNYSDAEIEVLYSKVNFTEPAYGEFSNCQEYANSLSGDGITAKVMDYC